MSYEKFITDFLNIKPSNLSKISTSTGSDGSVFIRIRLSRKSVLCPFCNGNVKVKAYYDRKLTHSTFANRFCYIIYGNADIFAKIAAVPLTKVIAFLLQEKSLPMKQK